MGHKFSFRVLTYLFCLFLLWGCQHKVPERAFYHWKSEYRLTSFEKKQVEELHINKIYIRVFDVDWNEQNQKPHPISELYLNDTLLPVEYIPVIYITNQTFQLISVKKIPELAQNVWRKTRSISKRLNLSMHEIQFDCDWSDATRANYFLFLESIKTFAKKENVTLSATIRLHQLKYKDKTGVPPVNRGVLMFYNMGKVQHIATSNSILNAETGASYLEKDMDYDMPLDIALPVFQWTVQFRNNKVIALHNNLDSIILAKDPFLQKQVASYYTVTKGHFMNGAYWMQNDVLRIEYSSEEELDKSVTLLNKKINTPEHIILYHLDSSNLARYEQPFIEKIFTAFQ